MAREHQGVAGKGAGPRAIYDKLRLEDEGFRESRATLSAVKRVCVRLKKARGVQPEAVAIPVETKAGEVAQVDFGYVGKLDDPVERVVRKAWVFVLVLGHSRHMVARIELGVPASTVVSRLRSALRKLGVRDGAQLIRKLGAPNLPVADTSM